MKLLSPLFCQHSSFLRSVINRLIYIAMGLPGGSDSLYCLPCSRPGFGPWVGKIPWRRASQRTPVFLPGESPWTEEPGGLQSRQSYTTEKLSTAQTLGYSSGIFTHFHMTSNFVLVCLGIHGISRAMVNSSQSLKPVEKFLLV